MNLFYDYKDLTVLFYHDHDPDYSNWNVITIVISGVGKCQKVGGHTDTYIYAPSVKNHTTTTTIIIITTTAIIIIIIIIIIISIINNIIKVLLLLLYSLW